MIADLKQQGIHISLWQLPYFVPKNRLFPEIIEKGLYVKDGKGNLPFEDAVLDFSNPATVKWYQRNLSSLLEMGVGAIKADFGESAPLNGVYANGRTGFYEHNLYPLRYNKAVAGITREISGENIIWARSAWAGSQRYPLHWGGDAATTDIGMSATLRGGLSLGLSGFSFWSHDIGGFAGFPGPTPELYRRWLPFGMLTSHSRCHGAPPKERRRLHRRFPPRRRVEVPPDALCLRPGQGLERARPAHAARPFHRVPGRCRLLDCRRRVPFRLSDPGGAAVRSGQHGPRRLSAAGPVDRLPDRPHLRRRLAPHRGREDSGGHAGA
jgi:hypothetical protein